MEVGVLGHNELRKRHYRLQLLGCRHAKCETSRSTVWWVEYGEQETRVHRKVERIEGPGRLRLDEILDVLEPAHVLLKYPKRSLGQRNLPIRRDRPSVP